mgnify:FL=1
MVTVTQSQFDGGIADDVRTHNINQCADSTNFDVFSNPYKLIHLRDMVAENDGSQTIADTEISDVGQTVISGTQYMVAFGENYPTDNKPAAFIRASGVLNGSWSPQAVGVGGYSYVPNSYVQYNGISYILGTNFSSPLVINLQKYIGAGTMTAIDTVSYTLPTGVISLPNVPRPFVHPTDNRMYIAVGNILAVWDGVSGSFTDVTGLLPSGFVATGITNYGDNLAIAMSPVLGNADSIICIWDRDYVNHATYLTSVIKCGQGKIDAFGNLDGILAMAMSPLNYLLDTTVYLSLKTYSGGQVEEVVGVTGLSTYSNNSTVSTRRDNTLYFVRYGDTALYCFGKNKSGRYILTHDYLVRNGSTSTADAVSVVYALNFVGSCLYVGYTGLDSTYRLMATDFDGSISYINPAVYTTTINPSMPIPDRGDMKRLVSVRVLFEGATTGTCTLEYATDGSSTFTTIDAHDMSDLKNVIEGSAESTGIAFKPSRDFQFRITSTWGAKIIGITYKYEKLPELT